MIKNNSKVIIEDGIVEKNEAVYKDDGIRGVDLKSKYNQNNLKCTDQITISQQNQKVTASYSKIEGLKNKNIENKINNNIIDKVKSLYPDELVNNLNVESINIYSKIVANFSNILSISIIQDISYLDSSIKSNYYGLNYELEFGKEIEFKDIFTYNTQIIPIIEQSAYEHFAWDYDENDDDGLDNDISKVDYSNIENRVYNSVIEYKNCKKLEFYFTAKYVFLKLENDYIKIDMSKINANIAIYTRYLSSNNLYEYDNYGLKNVFVFSERQPFFYNNIQDNKNCYIDISIYSDDNVSEKILNDLKNKVESKIDEIKQYVNNNPNRAVLYAGIILASNFNGTPECSFDIGRYEMSSSYYNSDFYDKIAEQAREDKVNASYYITYDEKYVTYQYDNTIIKYDQELY